MKTNSTIFKSLLAAVVACFALQSAVAQNAMQQGSPVYVSCRNASLVKEGKTIVAGMELNLSDLKLKTNQAAIFTPMIVKGADTLELPSIGVYGHMRWYQFHRSGLKPISGETEKSFKYSERPKSVKYSQAVNYRRWMNGSELMIMRTDYGCCGTKLDEGEMLLAGYRAEIYEPNFVFIPAVAEKVKTRELSGRAYVDFPVNLTTIYPSYRNNTVELGKIIATIDSVRNDRDITVKSLSIKGFASPEGPYDNNIRLAKGRTEALRVYVQQLYHFDYGFIRTSYEPEDWEGLRNYVESSNIEYKYGILDIIDSHMEPDAKNTKLQKTYPEQYKFLLETVYPALRHSDYCIEYEIRGYSDLKEIAEVMKTHPSKLSLNEMYLLAETYEPGSQAYNDIMETAAVMYPTDQTALLNAASAAMQRGDINAAEKYLLRTGNTPDALYARGILAGLQGEYDDAIDYFEEAAEKGNVNARAEIEQIRLAQKFSSK